MSMEDIEFEPVQLNAPITAEDLKVSEDVAPRNKLYNLGMAMPTYMHNSAFLSPEQEIVVYNAQQENRSVQEEPTKNDIFGKHSHGYTHASHRIFHNIMLHRATFYFCIFLLLAQQAILGIYQYTIFGDHEEPVWLVVIDSIVLWFFVMELMIRIAALRWDFFKEKWHIMELVLVIVSVTLWFVDRFAYDTISEYLWAAVAVRFVAQLIRAGTMCVDMRKRIHMADTNRVKMAKPPNDTKGSMIEMPSLLRSLSGPSLALHKSTANDDRPVVSTDIGSIDNPVSENQLAIFPTVSNHSVSSVPAQYPASMSPLAEDEIPYTVTTDLTTPIDQTRSSTPGIGNPIAASVTLAPLDMTKSASLKKQYALMSGSTSVVDVSLIETFGAVNNGGSGEFEPTLNKSVSQHTALSSNIWSAPSFHEERSSPPNNLNLVAQEVVMEDVSSDGEVGGYDEGIEYSRNSRSYSYNHNNHETY